jgi:hypothetical protein
MLSLLDTPPGALRRHDDLFNAALVSFGSFGVVHAYLVEVEDLYSLEAYSRRMDFDAVLAAMTTLDVSSLGLPEGSVLPFHFEIGLNLYRMGKGQKGAFVRFMYKRPGGTPAPPAPLPGGHRPGDDLLGIIGTLSDVVPALIPDLVTTLMDSNLPTYEAVRATPGYTFGPTTIRGKGLSTEMGFKLSDVGAAVDVMANVARVFPFATWRPRRRSRRSRSTGQPALSRSRPSRLIGPGKRTDESGLASTRPVSVSRCTGARPFRTNRRDTSGRTERVSTGGRPPGRRFCPPPVGAYSPTISCEASASSRVRRMQHEHDPGADRPLAISALQGVHSGGPLRAATR